MCVLWAEKTSKILKRQTRQKSIRKKKTEKEEDRERRKDRYASDKMSQEVNKSHKTEKSCAKIINDKYGTTTTKKKKVISDRKNLVTVETNLVINFEEL